ncbi:hypothetical protein B0H13DRAFT_1879043 [Mycena leptocephala]|nr:hypothetical protein B0H13DRAFT_1879043 [Mycena leptocephala]
MCSNVPDFEWAYLSRFEHTRAYGLFTGVDTLTDRGIETLTVSVSSALARMDAAVSLEHSLAQVLTALAQYEAVLRRNRGFPSDLDVTDAGEPGEVSDSGDQMKLNLEVASSPLQTGHCEHAACGASSYSSACELARFRTWTFPREKCKEPQETDPSGLSSFGQARAINSGVGVGSDPHGLPFDTGRSVPIGHQIQLHGADVESVKDYKHRHPQVETCPFRPSRVQETLIYADCSGMFAQVHPKWTGSYHIQHLLHAGEKHSRDVNRNLPQMHDNGTYDGMY